MFLKGFRDIEKEKWVIRYINYDLEISFHNSDKEVFFEEENYK